MIKNIIFDWSGVIKDSVLDHLYTVNTIFKKFGAKEMSLEELKENWVQPHMDFYNKYLLDIDTEQQTEIYRKAIMECTPKVYEGIVDVLKELKEKDFNMVVISSDFIETVSPELSSFGLNNIFLEVAASVYDKTEVIEKLIEKYNFDKAETIIVGDSNHEIEAGKVIGIKTIATTWGFTTESRLIAHQPDFIVHNSAELRKVFLK